MYLKRIPLLMLGHRNKYCFQLLFNKLLIVFLLSFVRMHEYLLSKTLLILYAKILGTIFIFENIST